MRIHPTENTPIASIVVHHFGPHAVKGAHCRLVGNMPHLGVTTLRPALAQMVDTFLADVLRDLARREATEMKLLFTVPGRSGFCFEVHDNGKKIEELPSVLEGARKQGADVAFWVGPDGWNIIGLTSGF